MGPCSILIIGYGTAVALLVVYFAWEGGPFHISRRVESISLTAILLLVYVVSFVWGRVGDQGPEERAAAQFRQLLRLMVLMMILQRSVLPKAHPRFGELGEPGSVRGFAGAPAAASEAAKRTAAELHAAIGDTLARSSGHGVVALVGDHIYGPAMFALLMIEEVVLAPENINTLMLEVLFCIEVSAFVLWMLLEVKRFAQLGGLYKQIHTLVSRMVTRREKEILNFVLATVSVGTLLEVARKDTVCQLTDLALEMGLLSTKSKAILVHALQQRGTRFNSHGQQAIWRLVFSCKGQELTVLKNLIDSNGGYLNLYKLVYEGLSWSSARRSILGHFDAQARAVRTDLGGAVGIKVLSDVDDTLYSSGGKFPAGCDPRFPRHLIYPGCCSLFRVLDQASDKNVPSCNLVFVSARPHLYKDLTEDHSYRLFRSLVSDGRLHSMPTLLPGTLRDGLVAALTAKCRGTSAWRRVGEAKWRTFKAYQALYPEYDFVFCGDNGQGDLLAAQRIAADVGNGDARLVAALIHEVLPGGSRRALALEPWRLRSEAWHEELRKKRIFFHKSYIGAAAELHHSSRGTVLSAPQLWQVAYDAINDFERMRLAYEEWGARWDEVQQTLAADLQSVRELLADEGLPWLGFSDDESPSYTSPTQASLSSPVHCSVSVHDEDEVADVEKECLEETDTLAAAADAARQRRIDKGKHKVCFLDRALSDLRRSRSGLGAVGFGVPGVPEGVPEGVPQGGAEER